MANPEPTGVNRIHREYYRDDEITDSELISGGWTLNGDFWEKPSVDIDFSGHTRDVVNLTSCEGNQHGQS